MTNQYSLRDISLRFGGQVVGDGDVLISRVSSLGNAKQGDICFINDTKYQKALADCKASAFILREKDATLTPQPKIIVDNPYAYFAKISSLLNPPANRITSFSFKVGLYKNSPGLLTAPATLTKDSSV